MRRSVVAARRRGGAVCRDRSWRKEYCFRPPANLGAGHRPHCCRSARLIPSSSTALVEITPEDELVTPVAVQQAIVRARYSGRSPRLIDETWGMRRTIGYGRASDGPAHAHPPQLATRGRRKALSRRLRGVEGAGGSGDERFSHSRPASPGGLLGDA